eukprot:CAMPEP_0172495940 /NCGR_PEP_ID=MMETSP1066-20121228/79746_1 /TAXON_ID=671091 /ORGANISM="Coscinodiscus wailesii, Strain CCMP2513" /LENGTH=318 /DNA_ID=CAMNT_0013267967 /DNA_START=17 /DNA_END=973 /DNA_ORIENTATION=-
MANTYTSDGFDLDAIPSETTHNGGETIYEIGGCASTIAPPTPPKDESVRSSDNHKDENDPLFEAESIKAKGNERFKVGDYSGAYDFYSDAIEAVPSGGLTGERILELRDEFDEEQREKMYERNRRESEKRMRKSHHDKTSDDDDDDAKKENAEEDDDDTSDEQATQQEPPPTFSIPPQPYSDKLSVYYANRAAALIHLQKYSEAVSDCDVALILNPSYLKALIRRMSANEKLEKTEEALADAKKAAELQPSNRDVRKHVQRLTKLEEERLERLKEETFGKLKDLGNSILGNFGLSLDNFKAQKDPNTGSYSISFEQNN